MASAQMPEEFFESASHHLPPESPVGPRGGRPRVAHRIVMRVIWFVLTTGCRWEDVPPELGCSGRTAHRRLRDREEAGIWDRLHADLLAALKRDGKLDPDTVVGEGSTIGANVFLTNSVPAHSLVVQEEANVKVMSKKEHKKQSAEFNI